MCGRLNNGPLDGYVLTPGTCEYGKSDFAVVIKLRVLRWGDFQDYTGGHNVVTRILIRGRQEVRKERRCCSAGFEDVRDHEQKNFGNL